MFSPQRVATQADSGNLPGMNCPVDDAPLQELERAGFKLASCPHCSGLWLTRDALKQAFESPQRPETLDEAMRQPPLLTPAPARARLCPGCHGQLAVRRLHGIEIDVCEQCHGLWLDAGELRNIIASHRQLTTVPPPPPVPGAPLVANAAPTSQPAKWYSGMDVLPVDLEFLSPLGGVLGEMASSGVEVAKPVLEFVGEALSSLDW